MSRGLNRHARRGRPAPTPQSNRSRYFRNGERHQNSYKNPQLQTRIDNAKGVRILFQYRQDWISDKVSVSKLMLRMGIERSLMSKLGDGQGVVVELHDYDMNTGQYRNIKIFDERSYTISKTTPDSVVLVKKSANGICSISPQPMTSFTYQSPSGTIVVPVIGGGRPEMGSRYSDKPGRVKEGIGGDRQLPADARLDRSDNVPSGVRDAWGGNSDNVA